MGHDLLNFVDISALQRLINILSGTTGLNVSVIDLQGKVIAETPQSAICTRFHQQHPDLRQICSRTGAPGSGLDTQVCPLGMADFTVPVRVGGHHVANLKMGQAFLSPPGEEALRQQARRYGFDEEDYLQTARAVPVISEERAAQALGNVSQMVEVLGDMGLSRLRELEARAGLYSANQELTRTSNYNRSLIEANADAMAVINSEGIVTDVNTAAERLTGKPRQQLIGTPVTDHINNPALARAAILRVLKDGSLDNLEMTLLSSGGQQVPVHINLRVFGGDHGEPKGILFCARDLTQQRKLEEKLDRARKFRLLAENSTDVILRMSPDGVCNYASPASFRVLGYLPEELNGMSLTDLFHPDDVPNFQIARNAINKGKRTFVFQVRIRLKDGEHIWTEASGQVFFGEDGAPKEVQASVRDISDRIRAEQGQKTAEKRIVALFDHMAEGVALHELIYEGGKPVDYVITGANPAFEAITGISRSTAAGMRGTALYGASKAPYLEIFAQVAETGRPTRFETYFPPMGKHFSISVFTSSPGTFACVFTDITERIKAANELREAKEFAEELISTANAIVIVLDANGCVMEFNRTAEKITGWTKQELIGRNWFDLTLPRDRYPQLWERFQTIGQGDVPASNDNPIQTKDGCERLIAWNNSLIKRNGQIAGIVSFGVDITDRVMMEKEIRSYQERLSMVMKNLDAVIFQLDHAGKCNLAEGRGLEMLSLTPQSALGRSYAEIMNFDARAVAAYRRAVAGKESTTEVRIGPTVFRHTMTPLFTADGKRDGIIGFSVDITDRVQAEQKLREEKERLRVTLQSIGDGVIATDGTGRVMMMNAVAEQLTGWPARRAIGRLFEEVFDIYNEETGAKCENPVEHVLTTGVVVGLANHTALRCADGTVRSIADSAAPILDDAQRVLGVILVFRDVTEEKQKEAEIAYLSYHDRLTGLYNRAFLEEESRRLDTARQLPISVIMGDVNGLKLTNDVFGHNEGDALLSRIAVILRECCRNEDIVARVGGDEFCILLPKTSYGQATEICKRIYARCELSDSGLPAGNAKLSISLGCGTKTEAGVSLDMVMKTAEDAMYRRKLLESRSQHSFIISSIRTTLFEKSFETEQHAQRLISYSKAVAQALGLPDDQVNDIELFALLHDIGKIAIDGHILTKPAKLTDAEWEEMRRHPEIGFRIAQSSPDLAHIAEYILCHHERWDGTGYPQGLKGTAIPLMARILLVVDAYDAMTQDRVYRKAMSKDEACAELLLHAGTQFDPNVVWAFLELLERGDEFA